MFFGKNKVHILSLGLAMGVLWGACMLFMGLMVLWFGWGTGFMELVSEWYIGFAATLPGVILGTFWGFVDGFVGGGLLAGLYNFFQEKLS